MWFGVAPAPAPSPRTNTKVWHPPHCTCARHANANAPPSPRHAGSVSPRRLVALPDDQRSRGYDAQSNKVEVSPRNRSLPRIGYHSVPTSSSPSSRAANKEDGSRIPHGTSHDDDSLPPESVEAAVDNQSGRRLPRRLSKRGSGQHVDGYVAKENTDQPELTAASTESESNNSLQLKDGTPAITLRPRTRNGAATRDQSKYECFVNSPNNSRLPTPNSGVVLPALPAPSKSRRGSRGLSRNSDTRRSAHGEDVQTPRLSLVQGEACLRLAPPMAERAQPTTLVGHSSSVGTVLVDEDNFIVSCSIDGSVKVWSRVSFSCLYTLYGHEDTVSCVDLSSQWLVSGSHDTTLRVYESGHGFRFVHSLEGHDGHVTRVKILADSSNERDLVLSCSDDCSLRLWNAEVGVCLAVFRSHTSRITCLLVVPGATIFCSGSADASVCFWDLTRMSTSRPLTTSRPEPRIVASLRSFRVHKSTVQCLLSGSSSHLAGTEDMVFSCSNDGTIQWFNAATLQHVGCVDSVQSPIYSMAFHATLGHLVCSTGDGRILIYSDWKTAIVKKELKVAPKWISSLQLLRGRLLACVSEGDLYVVNLERPRIERVLMTAHGFLNCVGWLKPERLATSGEDNVVKIWSLF